MSVENHNEKREVSKESLLAASANVIDQIGTVREGEKRRIRDAKWDDDEAFLKFELISSSHLTTGFSKKIFTNCKLKVFDLFSHDPKEYIRFDTDSILVQCDSSWKMLKDQEPTHVVAQKVQAYLESALVPKNHNVDTQFHDIVAEYTLGNEWFKKRAKRVGRRALLGGGERATDHLVKRTHLQEPFLSEEEIREAIIRVASDKSDI